MRKPLAFLLLLAGLALLVGCGESTTRVDQKRENLNRQNDVHQLQQKVADAKDRGTTSPAGAASYSGGFRRCSSSVFAGPNTSCPFAVNVRGVYYASGQSDVIRVFSPTTGRVYTMTCSSGSPHFCTGGNNASVLFR